MTKIQNLFLMDAGILIRTFRSFAIGTWSLFGVCHLEFDICGDHSIHDVENDCAKKG
jgi:hypothetical protein